MPHTLHYREIASRYYRIKNDELWMDGDYPVVWPLMAASCVAFGAFHCIAWAWQYPTDIERCLWQISSVVSTLSPLIPLAFTYFLIRRGTHALSCRQREAASEALNELRPLRKLPESWIRLFQTKVDSPNWRALFGEEIHQDRRDTNIAYAKCLRELRGYLSALEGKLERDRQANLLENIWKGLAQLKNAHGFMDEETWDMYEEQVTLDARSAGAVGWTGREPRVLKTIHDCCLSADEWTHRKKYQGSKKQLQETIRRYARPINISFGIVYSVSRIILIAIMFSSLREVPKGVYEVPGWTRFLPSFS